MIGYAMKRHCELLLDVGMAIESLYLAVENLFLSELIPLKNQAIDQSILRQQKALVSLQV